MLGAVRHLRRVVVAKDDVNVAPFILSDPPSTFEVIDVIVARHEKEDLNVFYERVNRFMDEQAGNRLVVTRLYTEPKN